MVFPNIFTVMEDKMCTNCYQGETKFKQKILSKTFFTSHFNAVLVLNSLWMSHKGSDYKWLGTQGDFQYLCWIGCYQMPVQSQLYILWHNVCPLCQLEKIFSGTLKGGIWKTRERLMARTSLSRIGWVCVKSKGNLI